MNKQLLGIYFVSMLGMVGVFNISPVLPVIADALQLSATQIAQVISAFTLGNVLMAPFVGLLADKLGRRYVLLPSLYLFGCAGVACGLVNDFGYLLFFRFLHGVGAAAVGVLAVTMIADLYQGQDRIRFFGYNMMVASIGMVSFPLLGSYLGTISWQYPFFIAGLAIPVAMYNQIFLRYAEPISQLNTAQYLRQLGRSFTDRRVLRLVYINFTLFILFGGAFLTHYAISIKLNYEDQLSILGFSVHRELVIGSCLSLFSLMVGLVSSRLGFLHQRFGFNRIVMMAFLTYALALSLFQFSEHIAMRYFSVALLGLSHGIVVPSIIALHTKLAPEGMTAAYITLNSLVFRLGQTVGPLLMAWVYIAVSLDAVFYVAAILAIPAALVVGLTQWRRSAV